MKTYKQFREELESIAESPQMIEPVDFNLNKVTSNRKFAQELAKKNKETLEDTPNDTIFRTGDLKSGYIVRVDKETGLITYLVKYDGKKIGPYKSRVTQTAVWRKIGSGRGITTKIFFDYLLKHFDTVMSDTQQTEAGKNFWLDQLADAKNKGLHIGLYIQSHGNTLPYDRSKPLQDWLDEVDGWGDDRDYRNRRFVISTKTLPI